MLGKEGFRSRIRQPRSLFIAALAERRGEAVAGTGIIMDRDARMRVQRCVHLGPHLSRDRRIRFAEMQQGRPGDGMRFAGMVRDQPRVIADAGIGIGPCRGEIGDLAVIGLQRLHVLELEFLGDVADPAGACAGWVFSLACRHRLPRPIAITHVAADSQSP